MQLIKLKGIIKRTITYKDMKIMLNLYKTLVRPHADYCVSAWSPHYKKDRVVRKGSTKIYEKQA